MEQMYQSIKSNNAPIFIKIIINIPSIDKFQHEPLQFKSLSNYRRQTLLILLIDCLTFPKHNEIRDPKLAERN